MSGLPKPHGHGQDGLKGGKGNPRRPEPSRGGGGIFSLRRSPVLSLWGFNLLSASEPAAVHKTGKHGGRALRVDRVSGRQAPAGGLVALFGWFSCLLRCARQRSLPPGIAACQCMHLGFCPTRLLPAAVAATSDHSDCQSQHARLARCHLSPRPLPAPAPPSPPRPAPPRLPADQAPRGGTSAGPYRVAGGHCRTVHPQRRAAAGAIPAGGGR